MADNGETRDARGEWQPDTLPKPSPLFRWPPQLAAAARYLFGREGFLFPYNAIYVGIATLAWLYLTPSMERMETLAFDWIALVYLRNVGLMVLVFGGLHLRLYVKRAQGSRYKYSDKWLATRDKRFLFGNQTLDNAFWSLVSGGIVWTAYESITLWAFANRIIPYVDWRERPVYCTLLLIGVLFMREAHFYLTHRLSHWKPLYKAAHYLHHKNVNIGPWSGMSMHPIEHMLYLSGIFLHWIIPSHPLHAMAHIIVSGLAPAKGHAGFYKFVVNGTADSEHEKAIRAGGYFHYLHHRYFTVNFGTEAVPLDQWFGSFHDGSPDAHDAMLERRKRQRNVM